jgi:hypothetical protein
MKTRKVMVLAWDTDNNVNGSYLKKEVSVGEFHGWGVAYEEFETGAGNYSTAIIELPDGSVLNHQVELIKFIQE